MLWPADTDWVCRGNSSVASSFNRPLSHMLLPLSSLQQENRIQWHLDKLQAHLGIPLSGIDWSWHFTSEVTSPDLDYDFIAQSSFECYSSQEFVLRNTGAELSIYSPIYLTHMPHSLRGWTAPKYW